MLIEMDPVKKKQSKHILEMLACWAVTRESFAKPSCKWRASSNFRLSLKSIRKCSQSTRSVQNNWRKKREISSKKCELKPNKQRRTGKEIWLKETIWRSVKMQVHKTWVRNRQSNKRLPTWQNQVTRSMKNSRLMKASFNLPNNPIKLLTELKQSSWISQSHEVNKIFILKDTIVTFFNSRLKSLEESVWPEMKRIRKIKDTFKRLKLLRE